MTLADYMVEKMIEHKEDWIVEVDDNGTQVIVNHNGACYGVRESDGTLVTAETLIKMFNEKIKIEV